MDHVFDRRIAVERWGADFSVGERWLVVCLVRVGVEEPEDGEDSAVIGVGPRQAEGIAAVLAYGVFEPVLIDCVNVKRRIGEDEVEVVCAVVLVFVIGVCFADIAFESVDG